MEQENRVNSTLKGLNVSIAIETKQIVLSYCSFSISFGYSYKVLQTFLSQPSLRRAGKAYFRA